MPVVERATIFSESDVIEAEDFGLIEPEPSDGARALPLVDSRFGELAHGSAAEQTRVSSAVGQVEEQLIRQAMVRYQGNKKRVAAELGISRSYLYKRLAQMGFVAEAVD